MYAIRSYYVPTYPKWLQHSNPCGIVVGCSNKENHKGEYSGSGRPTQFAGKIDLNNLNMDIFTQIQIIV